VTFVALAGCAHIHTPGFVKMLANRKDVSVKAVWDPDAQRARESAEKLSSTVVQEPQAIWRDPDIRGVVICSETKLHEQLVLPAAAAGKHLFVEKPLGFAAADAQRMADAITSAKVLFQTGYFMRGNRINRFLKRHVEQRSFGKITRVRASNCHSGALGGWFDGEWRWMADPAVAGCGAFGDLGTHVLDLLIWMHGNVREVCATLDNGTARYSGCDETGESLIRFENGVIGTLAAAWDDLADPMSMLISGTEGYAAVIAGQLFFHSKKVAGSDGTKPLTDASALGDDLPHAFELFLDALAGRKPTLVSPREAAYRSVVMQGMYESAQGRKWVEIAGAGLG
jgi:predicted dehydrogenase